MLPPNNIFLPPGCILQYLLLFFFCSLLVPGVRWVVQELSDMVFDLKDMVFDLKDMGFDLMDMVVEDMLQENQLVVLCWLPVAGC